MNGDWEIGTTIRGTRSLRASRDRAHDGTRISLVDRRALSSITLDKKGSSSLPSSVARQVTLRSMRTICSRTLKRKKIAIKPALMDQAVVAGLGNIYVAEALWEARWIPDVRRPKSRGHTRAAGRGNQTRAESEERLPGRYNRHAWRQPLRGLRSRRGGLPALRWTIERIVQRAFYVLLPVVSDPLIEAAADSYPSPRAAHPDVAGLGYRQYLGMVQRLTG